eukprot:6176711-Pleurochrysis_carterae.AAC.1
MSAQAHAQGARTRRRARACACSFCRLKLGRVCTQVECLDCGARTERADLQAALAISCRQRSLAGSARHPFRHLLRPRVTGNSGACGRRLSFQSVDDFCKHQAQGWPASLYVPNSALLPPA